MFIVIIILIMLHVRLNLSENINLLIKHLISYLLELPFLTRDYVSRLQSLPLILLRPWQSTTLVITTNNVLMLLAKYFI